MKFNSAKHISVIYGTYHSIDVVSKAQHDHDLADFDFIICDEAHRTTGYTWAGEEESHFVKVHDGDFLKARKRLYMTATPRIYGPKAQARQDEGNVALCSMDDEKLYGRDLHTVTFSEAVERDLLCDYKVIVLTVDAAHISRRLQSLLKEEANSLKVDDAARIVGCWKALAKIGLDENVEDGLDPMRRAVAFCQVIEANYKGKTHKVSSKQIAGMFQQVVESYQKSEAEQGREHGTLICEAEHIDGTMNAGEKEQRINWLKEDAPENTCRILSNVRCLSEGVDVPALDAVLFLTPKNSQVEVVQSVGRVMRKADGKQKGYVILPVVIPEEVEPHKALNDNKTYKVVWEVLQALRSHDDRFDAHINKLELIGQDTRKMEIIAVTDTVQQKADREKTKGAETGRGQYNMGGRSPDPADKAAEQMAIPFQIGEMERALRAKVVEKCGNRYHWEQWANDIAKIAQAHITRIRTIISDQRNKKEVKAFNAFAEELRDDLNDSTTDEEVIEMLAQHLITRPVFDALFEDYSFAGNNPVSQAMQKVLDVLQEHRLEREADTLESFYHSVKMRAEGISNAQGKQKIVVELYDKFFRNAFPHMTKRLGIVYTPVEVVDFIIHSIDHILTQEFHKGLGSEGVHILDPFTGTGTFIARLLQSGLINEQQLPHKYQNEIHANEIVLLAYYIAAINIEATYHTIMNENVEVGEHPYQPFEGICLTDTFQMYEKDDLVSQLMENNSDRRKRQKELDIRVIMGNPPYSVGQKSENDNAQNLKYLSLDTRIGETYAAQSEAVLKMSLYDSYIRAIRWASDRVGESGIIGFVTNAGFLEGNSTAGLRKCLAEEFNSIYVFHLRGNQRTQGELSRKEGGKIFGGGSRAPIAISLLVKNPYSIEPKQIHFHDIGDYLTRQQKLDMVVSFGNVAGITKEHGWRTIVPNEHGDWLKQRDDTFDKHIALGNKKGDIPRLFKNHSNGLKTQRDAWCYNYSNSKVGENMKRMIEFYNKEVCRFKKLYEKLDSKSRSSYVNDFINNDPNQISWTHNTKKDITKNKTQEFQPKAIVKSYYRPFCKQFLYFNRDWNERVFQIPKIFPPGTNSQNTAILINAGWSQLGNLCFITNIVPDLHCNGDSQCFPLYLYEPISDPDQPEHTNKDLFSDQSEEDGYTRRDAITDEGLKHFQDAYPGEQIGKEDIFYYVYGLLHSPEYRERYADNLSKEIPRIPRVKTAKGFRSFSRAGRELADCHLNYETVEPYPATLEGPGTKPDSEPEQIKTHYRVTKMKHPRVKNEEGQNVNDLSTVIYNEYITVKDIPVEAYDYVVNGKPAIEWVIDRQCVKTDKASGIINDANDWALETMDNPRYPLELLLRVITVSLETNKIVNSLPPLDID